MRLLGTKLASISSGRGFGDQLYDLSGQRPSLDLQFANQKSLVDATTGQNLVSFTRASSGTYVDSQGVIRTATTNLLLQSADISNAYWVKAETTVTANAITAPDGTTTAGKLIESINNSQHTLASATISWAGNTQYTATFFAKAGERSKFDILLGTGTNWVNSERVATFDLASGTVVFSPNSPAVASITPFANNWFRCRVTATTTATPSASSVFIRMCDNTGLASYQGIANYGLYLWGAQLEQSSTVGEYIPTTSTINSAPRFDHNPTTGESLGLLVEEQRTNLCLQSEDFGTTWTTLGMLAFGSGSTLNAIAAPDSKTTADLLTQDTANSEHRISSAAITWAGNTSYTFTVFAKANGQTRFDVLYSTSGNWTGGRQAVFDLSTGSVNSTDGATGSVTALPNGWYRCRVTALTTASPSASSVNIRFLDQTNSSAFTGNGTSGIYLWGAQLEAGAFPTSYIPTTTATATRSADVASISGSNFGVSRTNLLVRSEEFNDVAWVKRGTCAVVANDAIAPNGTLTADKVTFAGSGNDIYYGSLNVAAGTTVSPSIYVKKITASGAFALQSANGSPNGSWSVNLSLLSTSWERLTATHPAVTVNTAFTGSGNNFSGFQLFQSSGIATELHIWGAQLETGTTATAYIPTTSAAVTVVDSPWYRQDEGTVFAETQLQSAAARTVAGFDVNDNSTNNRIVFRALTSSVADQVVIRSGGATVFSQANVLPAPSTASRKTSVGYKANDFMYTAAGAIGYTGTSGAVPVSVTQMLIGYEQGPTGYLGGTIRRLTYWPQRLSNSTLQSITQ